MKNKNFTVVETFAGGGGLALGFEKAGFDTVMLVEYDKDCCATLKYNRPKWNVVCQDITKLSFKGVHSDVLTGGFPCQAFSHAGKKLGFEDTRGTVFFEFARAIKEISPKIFIGENVAGLKRHDNGKTLETIIDITKNIGYNVKYMVLNALDYGVAQKRKRIFIVGTKPGIEFEFPKPYPRTKVLKDVLLDVPESEGSSYSLQRKKVLDLVPPGGSWVDLPKDIAKEFMGKSYFSGGGRRGMARRISWEEPCLTLTTSPSQKFTERCHPEETRPFTIREYARIQDFPDDWNFYGSLHSKYRQIGNAVPRNLAKEVGLQVINALSSFNI